MTDPKTVRDLIAALQEVDPDLLVVVADSEHGEFWWDGTFQIYGNHLELDNGDLVS